MPFTLQAIFWGVITLSIVVFLHEGGHFLAARAFGLRVHEFMFGLPGPKLSFKRGDTRYGVTAIPFGGYTKIAGMDGDIQNENLQAALTFVTRAGQPLSAAQVAEACEIDDADEAKIILNTLVDWFALKYDEAHKTWSSVLDPQLADNPDELFSKAKEHTYLALPFWKRAVILLAGIVVNIVFALLVFTVVLSVWGQAVVLNKIEPVKGGPAIEAGLKKDDRIIKINNKKIATFDDITAAVSHLHPGDRITVFYVSSDSSKTQVATTLTLGKNPANTKIGYLGIEAIPEQQRLSLPHAAGQSFSYVKMTVQGILGFFTPGKFTQSVNNSASIVGISVIAADAAKAGGVDYSWLVAAISLSLGLMNLLPIPPLDGGKVIVEAIEAIRRKPLSLKANASVSAVGLLLLVTFMIYVMGHDIFRLTKLGG